MIDGIPNQPLYYYQKDIIGFHRVYKILIFTARPQLPNIGNFRGLNQPFTGILPGIMGISQD